MEENKDNNQINETVGITASENAAGSENPQVNPPANNIETPPKKSRKKLLIVISVILSVLIAGAISAYFILKNNSSEDSVAPVTSEVSEEISDDQTKLFMQFDQKIVAYDTASKQSSIITDKVPKDSTVIDFYYGSDDEWRYYADDFNKIYFSDESSDPEAVADATPYVVANAEKKIFAYQEVGALENSTSKTYLSTDNGKPELVYESANNSGPDAEDGSSPKSYLYVVRDVSSSGEEILYQQEPCFECGGIGLKPYSNLFKLNLKTKKAEVINQSDKGAQYSYFNDNDEVILVEDNTKGYDTGDLRIDIKAYLLKNDTRHSAVFRLHDDKDLLAYSLSHNGDFAVTQLKGKNYNNEESNTSPGELYSLNGNETETLKSDLERYGYILGNSAGDCIAAGFEDRALINDDFVYQYSVGVICKDDSDVYTYNPLEDVTNSGDSAEEVIYSLL